SIVAFIPRSWRPGFFGIPLFCFSFISVVVRAGEEVAALANHLALAINHLRAAIGAAGHHQARINLSQGRLRDDR
uniref:hypothetical protein n=1 Tax=Candidatus Limnocylindrus sp. TaxID=2802978 RepID=UPI0040495553